jgi:hypothetical protein
VINSLPCAVGSQQDHYLLVGGLIFSRSGQWWCALVNTRQAKRDYAMLHLILSQCMPIIHQPLLLFQGITVHMSSGMAPIVGQP